MSKTFNQVTTQTNTLMIVDALNLAFRYKHSGATDFAEDYLRTVDSLRRSYKASKVIIACDQGSSSYRKSIYPDYKQNRKDKFDEQTEAEKAAFVLFFEEFQKTIQYIQENSSYPVLKFQGVEADDIAAVWRVEGELVLRKDQHREDQTQCRSDIQWSSHSENDYKCNCNQK